MQNDLFVQLQVLDLSSSKVKQVQPLQELLGCMQELAVLRLEHTPLAECCRAGKVQEQVRNLKCHAELHTQLESQSEQGWTAWLKHRAASFFIGSPCWQLPAT